MRTSTITTIVLFVLTAIAASAAATAAAASFTIAVHDHATGAAYVAACDADTMHFDFVFSDQEPTTLDYLVISQIDDRCDGLMMNVEIADENGVLVWHSTEFVPVGVGATTMVVPTAVTDVDTSLVAQTAIQVTGHVAL